jgi:hypothetical protein
VVVITPAPSFCIKRGEFFRLAKRFVAINQ